VAKVPWLIGSINFVDGAPLWLERLIRNLTRRWPNLAQVHVVAKVSSANTKKVATRFFEQLANRCVTFELLLPEQVTSAVLTQVSAHSHVLMRVGEVGESD
jgi:hypothetical protein